MRHRFLSQLSWFQNAGFAFFLLFNSNLKLTVLLSLSFFNFSAVGKPVFTDRENPTIKMIRQVNRPNRVVDLLASQLTMIILALSIVALRLISRFFVDKNPGWDDCAIIAATVNKIEPLENRQA